MKQTKRYNQTIAGRVTPAIRNWIRPRLQAFAREQHRSFNTVFGAVLLAAEQLPGRVTRAKVLALINPETVEWYDQEQYRIARARVTQLEGMAWKALPADRRNTAAVDWLVSQVVGLQTSIPSLNARLRQLARQC